MKLKNNQQLAKIISVNDNLVRRWVEDVEFRKRNPNVSAETSHWDIEATSGLEDKERVKMNADTVSDDLSIIGFEPMQTKGHSRTNLVRIASVKDKKLQKEIINKQEENQQGKWQKILSPSIRNPTSQQKKHYYQEE